LCTKKRKDTPFLDILEEISAECDLPVDDICLMLDTQQLSLRQGERTLEQLGFTDSCLLTFKGSNASPVPITSSLSHQTSLQGNHASALNQTKSLQSFQSETYDQLHQSQSQTQTPLNVATSNLKTMKSTPLPIHKRRQIQSLPDDYLEQKLDQSLNVRGIHPRHNSSLGVIDRPLVGTSLGSNKRSAMSRGLQGNKRAASTRELNQ